MNIPFLKYTKVYYIFSGVLILASLISLLIFGLKFSIDFLGGSILEVNFENRPENSAIQEKLKDINNLGEMVIQPTGAKGVIMRMKEVDENIHQQIISRLQEISKIEEKRFESIGPVIGKELRQKTIILIIVSLAALLIYIAVAFRKISRPLSSWQYGIISIITLFFDVLIPIGVFASLGKFYNVQFSIPIVIALLTLLGYTINDKVVVFDRVRENLLRTKGGDFNACVNQSLNQVLVRSISTGSCTLLVLLAIFFFGGETLKYFSLTLIIGIIVGTCSSLFLASPLLVSWQEMGKRYH
ncbi:MAG: protein translocase subunit SecF [bacterium]|nr:protein translocase subunit SecF [bacterium]